MIRTDLACELRDAAGQSLKGVLSERREQEGFRVEEVRIRTEEGARSLGRPVGTYLTLELGGVLRREDGAFSRCASALSRELAPLLPPGEGCVLVAGLGNRRITPDSIGPGVVRWTLATRHLCEGGEEPFRRLRPVAALAPGVLGDTGLETAEFISSVTARLHPRCVIAVDALASRSLSRLCRTVQLSDTGIVPGSGVGNRRRGLNRESLGCPVLAVGVPTVVDARTLAADISGGEPEEMDPELSRGLIVTPREIDAQAAEISRLIGYGLNLCLQPGLSIEDLDLLLG